MPVGAGPGTATRRLLRVRRSAGTARDGRPVSLDAGMGGDQAVGSRAICHGARAMTCGATRCWRVGRPTILSKSSARRRADRRAPPSRTLSRTGYMGRSGIFLHIDLHSSRLGFALRRCRRSLAEPGQPRGDRWSGLAGGRGGGAVGPARAALRIGPSVVVSLLVVDSPPANRRRDR